MSNLSTIWRTLPLLAFLLCMSPACNLITGEEIARIPVNRVSTEDNYVIEEASVELKKDDQIAIWSEMDMEYEGEIELRFRIEVLKDGEEFGGMEVDPTDKNITIGEVRTEIMAKTTWEFSGKNSEITIEEDGNYTFKVLLASSENPSLNIKKAEIVLKK